MSTKFAELGLSQAVTNAVADAGYETPTDIQQKAIPHILDKRDVIGIAQTGTGKTASFVLPMLTLLEKGRARARMPRTLILEPTRELAAQVHENFEKYGKNHKLTVALLIGGVSFEEQNKKLDRGADVLIATPGRLLDHFERGRLLMTGVDVFVIDEADRMLDMGFIPDIERISALLPKRRQTLFLSATMPDEVAKLTSKFLQNPVSVETARQNSTADTITQKLIKVGGKPFEKRAALREQIDAAKDLKNAIIFCNRKRDIATLTRSMLRHDYNTGALHGDMDQKSRMATLDGFKKNEIKFLIASDVAARGLDIPDVSHVFNFDIPTHAEDYVHRIGRTGRAGRDGVAVTLVAKSDQKYLDSIEKLIEKKLDWIEPEKSAPDSTEQPKQKSSKSKSNQRRSGPSADVEDFEQAAQKSSSHKKGKRNNRKNEKDSIPFGQSDQVPAFLLRPVRQAS